MVVRESLARLRRAVRVLLPQMEEGDGLVAAAPVMELREIFGRFWPYARPYRRWLPLILLFAALGSALQAATIWMYKILVDEVLVPRDFGLLLWVVLAYLGLTLAEGVASFCEDYSSEWVGGRFIVSLRTDLFRHLQGLSLSFFDRRSLGDMLARLSDDIQEIEELMISEMASTLTYLFQFVFFVGALFYLQWRLALVSLFVVPLFLLVARFFSRKLRRATREERRRSGSVSAVAEESLSNSALVQAYNRQENEVSRFRRENEGSFVADMAATRLDALFSPLVNLIEVAGVGVVIAASYRFHTDLLSRVSSTIPARDLFSAVHAPAPAPATAHEGHLTRPPAGKGRQRPCRRSRQSCSRAAFPSSFVCRVAASSGWSMGQWS